MNKVYVLTEEGDVVAVFSSQDLALQCVKENQIMNFYIQEFTVRSK